MSIIKVTEKMLRKFETLDKNWYAFEVVETATKKNKNDNLELRVVAKVLEGEMAGVETQFYLYPESFSEPFIQLASAVEQTEIKPNDEIDPDRWVGKQFWSEALIDTYEGKVRNKFEQFRAIGDTPAF